MTVLVHGLSKTALIHSKDASRCQAMLQTRPGAHNDARPRSYHSTNLDDPHDTSFVTDDGPFLVSNYRFLLRSPASPCLKPNLLLILWQDFRWP